MRRRSRLSSPRHWSAVGRCCSCPYTSISSRRPSITGHARRRSPSSSSSPCWPLSPSLAFWAGSRRGTRKRKIAVEHRYEGLEAQSFKIIMWGLAGLCFLLLVMPTLVVIVVSFTSGFSLKFPPPGYSLRWYAALLDAWQLHFAASNSLKIAVGSTLLAVVLGVAAALAIARSEKWSARVLDSLFMSPL